MQRRFKPSLVGVGIGLMLTLHGAVSNATIEEQRARLPPPAECPDPVAGIWHAHVFYEHVMQWYVFKLDIRREAPEGEALTGTIVAEFWNGDHERSAPPLCGSSGREAVRENATGRATGLAINFDATDWTEDPTCGFSGGYLLDHFSGTIDTQLQEFQSVLNADAPEWRDVPTVFRRVECHQGDQAEDDAPRVVVKPPPFFPPEAPSACGFQR